jgi:hypothetical protein
VPEAQRLPWTSALAALAALAGASGCSSSATGTLKLVTGEEDAGAVFDGVDKLVVNWIDSDAGSHSIATVALSGTIDLGSVDRNSVGMIEVTGKDDAGSPILFGATIPLQFSALDGATVPIFVQRMGELARMPSPPADARHFPLLGVLGGRYLVSTGGSDTAVAGQTSIYDFLSLTPLSTPPAFSPAPESIVYVGTVAYLIDSNGVSWADLSNSTSGTVTLPSSAATAADIAGGATIAASGGVQYVVGATRTTHGPTKAVLKFDAQGNMSWALLDSARLGAAALWMDSLGLVVLGGDAKGAGVEVIATNGAAGVALQGFAADPTIGAGAATLDGTRYVVVAGGLAPDATDPGVRVLDLKDCMPCTATWPSIPTTLALSQVFASDPEDAVVVGNELVGLHTRVFKLSSAGVAEIPLKVPRIAASALAYPLGTPGSFLVAGGADEIESFVPSVPSVTK